MDRRRDEGHGNLQCSFCGKSQKEVKKLIAGPTVYIRDECIGLAAHPTPDDVGGAIHHGRPRPHPKHVGHPRLMGHGAFSSVERQDARVDCPREIADRLVHPGVGRRVGGADAPGFGHRVAR